MAKSEKKVNRVVVRSYGDGVFVGLLVGTPKQSGAGRQCVVLDGSRRLWKWRAAKGVALSGVAVHGIINADSKVGVPIDGHTVDDVIEILPMTEAAWRTLE